MKKDDDSHDSGAPTDADGAMVTSDTVGAVTALMEQRRQYESWLLALDARKASTPDHVFRRVQVDYTARLDAVLAQLMTHAGALRKEIETLSGRIGALDSETQRATDERAEAELRAHVGELSAPDWEQTASSIDSQLSELRTKQSALEENLRRTRDLLAGSIPPDESTAQVGDSSEAELHVPMAVATSDNLSSPVTAIPEVAAPKKVESVAATPDDEPRSTFTPNVPKLEESSVVDIAPAKSAAAPTKSTFDELAFLSSVVDTPAGSVDSAPKDEPDERTRRDTFAVRSQEDAIVNLTPDLTPPRQLAAIEYEKEEESLLSSTAPLDGSRTLKCYKCGVMNYPTEWYCESCGSELASL